MKRLVSFDWAFKYLLKNKANFDILEGFLSELLNKDIYIECILESESNKNTATDKFNRVDLLVQTGKKEQIIIEVQCTSQMDYLSRILYGTSKVITEHIHEGESYKNIRKIISVSVVFFNMGAGADYIYEGSTVFRGRHCQDILRLNENERRMYEFEHEYPSDIYPEFYIIKVNQFNERIRNKFDEWVYFLKNEKIKSTFKAKGIHSAAEKLDVLRLNEEERRLYERYQDDSHYEASMIESHYGMGKKEGREEGRKEGMEEGREEGRQEGIHTGELTLLLRQLQRKFGVIPLYYKNQIEKADTNQLLLWGERILEAKKLEDIFEPQTMPT